MAEDHPGPLAPLDEQRRIMELRIDAQRDALEAVELQLLDARERRRHLVAADMPLEDIDASIAKLELEAGINQRRMESMERELTAREMIRAEHDRILAEKLREANRAWDAERQFLESKRQHARMLWIGIAMAAFAAGTLYMQLLNFLGK